MFCPHCHNKIPDGSELSARCATPTWSGVKPERSEKEERARRRHAPRPEAEARAEEKQRQDPPIRRAADRAKRESGQDADDYRNRPDPDSGADYCDDRAIHVRGEYAGGGEYASASAGRPSSRSRRITSSSSARRTRPRRQLTATPNIEITPTPGRAAGAGRDDIQDAAQG